MRYLRRRLQNKYLELTNKSDKNDERKDNCNAIHQKTHGGRASSIRPVGSSLWYIQSKVRLMYIKKMEAWNRNLKL